MTIYTLLFSGLLGADCSADPSVCSVANSVCDSLSSVCECDLNFVENGDSSACLGKLIVRLLMLCITVYFIFSCNLYFKDRC